MKEKILEKLKETFKLSALCFFIEFSICIVCDIVEIIYEKYKEAKCE